VPTQHWRRYLAPAAFLLAATIAVVLIRSGLESGGSSPPAGTTAGRTAPPVTSTKTTTTRRANAPRFWTVRAGDTFGVISAKTGVPVRTIEELNPNVHSTSLFIGQRIRLR
jgi:hypothetical protein